MPSRVYTERFLYAEGTGKAYSFTVPEGKRAIVTFVAMFNSSTAQAELWLGVHGVYPLYFRIPESQGCRFEDVRLAAYERETVSIVTAGADTHVVITGYLFNDAVGDPPWAPGAAVKPIRPAPPGVAIPIGEQTA